MTSRKGAPKPVLRRRVFLVDDHPITRYGLMQLLGREPDLQVCGEAGNAQQALAALDAVRPDLLLVDITMPGKSGLELVRDVRLLHPAVLVLVVSMHDETVYAERMLRAGARGYIMKDEGGEKLLEAIRQVLAGEVYVSKRMASAILNALAPAASANRQGTPASLSNRELEVFQLIGQGLSTRDIALRLHVSGKTVATHRAHMKEKLGLQTGPELIQQAVHWAATQQLV